ncbi:MAG: hypothetical protein WCX73_05350 [Candidatus Pacearchaeota archaeon]|jgi:hypothetical protein
MTIEQWLLIMNVIIASANLVFIYFYFMQLRESKKAVIMTKFIGAERGNGSKQEIMENLPQYLYVENISKNKLKNLTIIGTFYFNKKEYKFSKEITYLNPHERAKILIRLGDLIDKYPELFEELKDKREGSLVYLKIPKENLNITFKILFKWSLFNKQEDEYFIEWLSKKSCPDLKYHPKIMSWNKRNNVYMEKIK